MNIVKSHISSINRPRRMLKELKGAVVHWTANMNTGANARAHFRYFNKTNRLPSGKLLLSSAHYMVDSTEILEIIPPEEVAYHVGARWERYTELAKNLLAHPLDSPNNYLIGIEMCVNKDGDFSKTEDNTLFLLEQLHREKGVNLILRHYDITRKNCPKMYLTEESWTEFLSKLSFY